MVKVIVIGAGVAGLAAARELHSKGVEVTILEGRDRIGGRVATVREGFGCPLDLGASWLHFVNVNPLKEVADALKLTIDVTYNPTLTSGTFKIYDYEGKNLDPLIEKKTREKFEKLTDHGKTVLSSINGDISLEALFELGAKHHAFEFSGDEQHFLEWLKSGIEGWENTNLSELSAKVHLGEYDKMVEGGDGFVVHGYGQIVEELARELKGKIHLNQTVLAVCYGEGGVTVETTNGTFTGDYCLCTLPLGVLKSNTVTFVPPLPSRKKLAIEKIGFGLMNKIILQFSEPFWDKNAEGFGFVSKYRGEFSFFLNLYPLLQKPILMCFVAADFAYAVERFSDKIIIDRIVQILSKIYGNGKQVEHPVAHKITRWRSDPFARGSYSFMKVGSSPEDIKALAEPTSTLHFAGEATYESVGYAHGAFLSGKREAELILADINEKKKSTAKTQKRVLYVGASAQSLSATLSEPVSLTAKL